MKPRSKSSLPRTSRGLFCLGAALVFAAAPTRACGPFFPNRYLEATTAELLSAPEAYFVEEVWRLMPAGTRRVAERDTRGWDSDETRPTAAERSAETDVAELAAALRAEGRDEASAKRLANAYREARRTGAEAPAGTPRQFALYLRGAQAWKRGDVEAARAAWRELWDLPEAERRARSVWAAYMLGRSWLVLTEMNDRWESDEAVTPEAAAAEAVRWFALAEERAAKGDADALGLAGEAKGWRARLAADRGRFAESIALYLERLAEGDDTAAQSLRRVARRTVESVHGEELDRCAADERTRGVVVAYLLSRGKPSYDWRNDRAWTSATRDWALAILRVGGREVHGADRLGWLAYEGGLFGLAKDWLQLAPADSAEADWLRSKLALRRGDAAKGAEWLERALREDGLAGSHRSLAWAELARARLALDQQQTALVAFLRGGHEEDAAFLAEQVLTVDELAQVVGASAERPGEWIRHLLARRLVREEEGARALAYLPEKLRPELEAYLVDHRIGFDAKRPAKERAEALMRAARVMRRSGMELAGTAVEPDWAIWDGSYENESVAETRLGEILRDESVFAPTAEERTRIRKSTTPERRFHYRYEAAQLAWWAASLMPDESEETARVLCEAGGWIKKLDPKAAEPFYRAMVLRCGKTSLGREAARLRWFPSVDEG